MSHETPNGQAARESDEPVIAAGVDEEPVEANRRMFDGRSATLIAALSALYAAFHVLALNGTSISAMTGGAVDIPFLPTFPMETWNFRIVHVAGALAIGFLIFSGTRFPDSESAETRSLGWLSLVLMAPALFSLGVALSFAVEIANGAMWNGIDPASSSTRPGSTARR